MTMELRTLLLLLASQLYIVTCWTVSTPVKRIQIQDFDADRYYQNSDDPKPLIITNALSPDECEQCADALMSMGDQLNVDLQSQVPNEGTEVYPDTPLAEALDAILYESNAHDEAFLTFCEGLLDNDDNLQVVRQKVTQARESLFSNDADWFLNYFPSELQPSDAVVIAGAGATSTLHRDPFEWMGTSLCIEGSKVWRFVDPKANVKTIDAALQSYRLESIAWEGRPMSAGWQSDLSLYRTRQEELPSAREWSEMEDDNKLTELLRVGSSIEILTPDDLPNDDLFFSTAIQEAGDLLLIPAHWWHQTFALEPSAAIASQRCGHRDSTLVLQHILNHNQVTSTDAKTILAANSPADAVGAVLSLVS